LGRLVRFIHSDFSLTKFLATAPSHRNKGLASKLVKDAERYLMDKNLTVAALFTDEKSKVTIVKLLADSSADHIPAAGV
jgi:GNAT superfamily N-acetyltransferase